MCPACHKDCSGRCSGGGGGRNIKTLEVSSRIYITRQDPANLSSGWDLSAKSQVGLPAASGDSCVAKATKSRQRHRRGSAMSPGTPPPKPVRWEPGGCRASALHVAQTIPRFLWTELCHQPVSHEDSSPGQEARTFQLGWAPFASSLGGYFQILGDVPLPLHLIGPRCPLFPQPPSFLLF